ncbi:MAG: hypothetical protein HKL85_09910 [Acidimicrobiaceae bacterium]|nr:hypothetical protein [Acidimicrobiaceae bacterium]
MQRVSFRRNFGLTALQWRAALVSLTLVSVMGALTLPVVPAGAVGRTSPTEKLMWSAGTTLVSGKGGVASVSCASAIFCVAGDLSGAVSTYNGSSWTTPVVVDATRAITAISCPTATFCVATDQVGNYIVWNGASWSAPTAFATPQGPIMVAVSCVSSSFCLAVGRTANFTPADYYYFNGTWFSDTVAFASTDVVPFDAVSCTASFICFATDQGGGVMMFNFNASPPSQFTHPPLPTPIDPGVKNFVGASISCVSSSSCVVGSVANQVSTFNGTNWTTQAVFAPSTLGVLVSCAVQTCLANNSSSEGVSSLAPFSTWSSVGQLNAPSQINALSCFASGLSVACLAVDNDGFSIAVTLGAGGVPFYSEASSTFDAPHTLTSVTCASATYCIASDAAGEIMTYRAGSWSPPQSVTTIPLGIREIRCGASSNPLQSLHCAAVVGNYLAFTLAPETAKWTPVPSASPPTFAVSCAEQCEYLSPQGRSSGVVKGYLPQLPAGAIATDVSCASGNGPCVAVDSAGGSYLSSKGRWVLGPRVEKQATLWSISCVSENFCEAVDIEGKAFSFNGTKWSAPQTVAPFGLYNVSCGATYFCVASGLSGGAYVFNGATWSSTASVGGSNVLHGLACASATSCVGIDGSQAFRIRVPTDPTKITLLAPLVRENVVGRTIVGALVTSTSAPHGEITLSAGLGAHAPSCVATLRSVSARVASAHCTVGTTHVGETTIVANFYGSFGFAPAPMAIRHEMIIAK